MQERRTKLERMDRVLEVWVSNPMASENKLAELSGVSRPTIQRYKRDKEFMEKYHEMCRQRFNSFESMAVEKLREALETGNWQAVKYVLDSLDYGGKQKVDANVNTDVNISIGE